MTKKLTNIEVRGFATKIYLQSREDYDKDAPDDSTAYIEWGKRSIYFNVEDFSKETIRHELTHAYIKASFTEQIPDLTLEQIEEIFCEVVSHFGINIIKQANDIHKEILCVLKEEKKRGNSKNKEREPKEGINGKIEQKHQKAGSRSE